LGFIFVFLGFFCDSAWGILAGSFRNWLASNDRRLVQLRIVGGVVMMGLGVITFVNSLLQK
jgi:threonine/homoserine/homoserine lactone efflux protein